MNTIQDNNGNGYPLELARRLRLKSLGVARTAPAATVADDRPVALACFLRPVVNRAGRYALEFVPINSLGQILDLTA